jgi:O-methyltransferase
MSKRHLQLDDRLYSYLVANQAPEHRELLRLRRSTERMPDGHMRLAPEQGHFLAFLARLIDARHILEIGTFTGCGALSLALALPSDGKLVTCDIDERCVSVGRPHWQEAGVAGKIEVIIGPALATLARLEAAGDCPFDLAFIDADKPEYDAYYEYCLRLVRPGGLIVFDNMLQRGEVADPLHLEPPRVVVRRLNAKIAGDERVDRVLLPIADGMTLVRRRASMGSACSQGAA